MPTGKSPSRSRIFILITKSPTNSPGITGSLARGIRQTRNCKRLILVHIDMQEGTERLHYGTFFGSSEIRLEVPGFSVSLLRPTLRAEDVPLHTHQSASFVFVLSGAYMSEGDGAAADVRNPILIFNPAGTTHRDRFVSAEGCFLAISMSDEILRLTIDAVTLPATARAFLSGPSLNVASRIASHCMFSASDTIAAIEGDCWELISVISGASLWPTDHRPAFPSWIGKARELLQDRCTESLPITELAQDLALHPVYFSRAFRNAFRCTPSQYRMRCRLQRAIALSRNPQVSLADVALMAGFFDQSHFTKAFRKEFGITPCAYRKHLHRPSLGTEVQLIQE